MITRCWNWWEVSKTKIMCGLQLIERVLEMSRVCGEVNKKRRVRCQYRSTRAVCDITNSSFSLDFLVNYIIFATESLLWIVFFLGKAQIKAWSVKQKKTSTELIIVNSWFADFRTARSAYIHLSHVNICMFIVISRKESSIEKYIFSLLQPIIDFFLFSIKQYIRSVDLLELGTPMQKVCRILHDVSWLYCERIVRTNTELDFIDFFDVVQWNTINFARGHSWEMAYLLQGSHLQCCLIFRSEHQRWQQASSNARRRTPVLSSALLKYYKFSFRIPDSLNQGALKFSEKNKCTKWVWCYKSTDFE